MHRDALGAPHAWGVQGWSLGGDIRGTEGQQVMEETAGGWRGQEVMKGK